MTTNKKRLNKNNLTKIAQNNGGEEKNMFRSFFEDYWKKVYTASLNKLNRLKSATIGVLATVFIVAYFMLIYANKTVVRLISAIVCVLISTLLLLWSHKSNKRMKKNHTKFLNNYRDKHTNELTNILKSPKYNLYCKEGIDWLIHVCQNKLNEYNKRDSTNKFSDFLCRILIPVFPIVFAPFADNLQPSIKIAFALVIILTLLLMFAVSKVRSAIKSSLFSDKAIIQQLLDDMEYLKVQITNVP